MDWEVRATSLLLLLGILLATIQNGLAERKIVCYYTNWSVYRPGTAKFSPQNINPYLCTHLIYAFGGFTKDNALRPFDKYQDIEKGGYAKFTGLKTYNKNLKTILAIGGWNEGSSRFSPMVADPAKRREFVKNTVKFLRQNHFDGLDLDWEYPAFRDGGKPRDKDNYANLVQELREEFDREASKTGRTRLLLSMAMPAGIEYIDKGYDVPRLNDYLDFINLLSYDYHSAYEPAVNHHAPLYPLEEDNEYNYDAELTIDYTISHLLEKGASADKIVLGIPTYGRSYTLFNQDSTDLGSPADGPGVEGDATREKGYLAYYEICENIAASDEWEVVQPNSNAMGPYAFKGDQWVGYDDEDIVKLKARYVKEKKLGGIMFWSIDNDDFRGKCHGRPYPLIEAAKEALLSDNRNTVDKTKSVDTRKKTRIQTSQSNTVARKLSSSNRRVTTTTTTTTAAPRKRVSSTRTKSRRPVVRPKESDEEDREVSRRSYEPPSVEDSEGKNTVRVTEKTERPKSRSRSKTRSDSADRSSRRKQSRRKEQSKIDDESLSNKLTTPEPPTTPDPGTDFKCEDEGFFPHPRDCKKYFWCLDSGPSGLGVVAHQFTCPSGLVFNKAADSCDYPRNVICPKSKTSVVTTTRSPITAATSRTTYLHSTTTPKAEVKQEVEKEEEEYDSEEDYDEAEIEEEEEEEVKEEAKTTTTAKPLVYKTLTRSRPSTTTTTSTTPRPSETEERIIESYEDEEDPRVIKELIDLIKKAGGIEQLEKQLLVQERNSDTTLGSASVTQATISRSLYERVLNRQANKIGSQRPVLSSSETSYVNGPGRAQFEGLDDIPEVKSLRRSQKPQYVTIERPKSSKRESEDENEGEEEDEEDDNAETAFTEEQIVSNPLEGSSSVQRVTPNYVNIRRARPSTTTSRNENDVGEKEAEIEEERPTRRRRPFFSPKQQHNEASSEASKPTKNRGSLFRNSEKSDSSEGADQSGEKNDGSSTTKSRYTSIQRFRSTTPKVSEEPPSTAAPLTGSTSETVTPIRVEEYPKVDSTPASTTSSPETASTPTTSTSTEVITVISVEPSDYPSSVGPPIDVTVHPTTESVKLVEDSATEILLTTLPASSTSQVTSTTTASRSTIATVSQPRPFGFTRRRSGGSPETATTTTPTSNQVRPKVADTESAIRLPTLKELIGYPTTYDFTVTAPSVLSHLPRFDVDNDISRQTVEESDTVDDDLSSEVRASRESGEKELLLEETGDSWLRFVSESKARSYATPREGVTEKSAATNVIQEDENKPGRLSTATYLKATTMRGIPLASLTPSSVMRGFYVTKDDDGLWATWTESPKITYSPVEQTETTPSFDFSTTDEVATVSYSQSELKSSVLDNQPNDTVNQEEDANEINVTTLGSSATSSEDLNHEEPKVTTSFVEEGSMSKRGKSLHDFTRGSTSLPNIPVVSPTTPTRRAIALAVSRYNEFTTPLWTGRRIVAKKRIRTTVSPIRDAIRRIESDSVRNVASPSKTVSPAISSTPIATKRRFPLTPTVPTTPIIASERAILPETVNNPTNAANGETKDPKNHVTTEAAMTLTTDSSTAESEPSIATISVDFVEDLASRVTNELGISTTPGSTDVTDDTSTVATQSPVIYDSTIFEDDVKDESTLTTANYMAAADPTTASENPASTSTNYFADASLMSTSTHAIIIVDSANTGLEIVTSAIVDHPEITVTTDTPVNMATDPVIKSYTTTTAIPETTNTYDTMTDPEPTTTVKVATIEVEAASTSGDRPANTILTTVEEERLTTPEIITSTMMPTEIESTTKSFTTDTMTTLTTTIGPATTDYLKTITESANTNEPPSTDTPMIADDVSTTTINPESIFETLSDLPNTDPASTVTEFSTTPFVAPTGHNISDDMEAPNATEIAESTTEIPTTSETFPTLAIAITTPKSFVSTDPETSTAATTAFSTQTYETSTTPMVTRTSSSFLPVASTVEIKDSSSIPETSRESVATNTILQATTARTISEGFTRSKLRKQSPTTVSEVVTMRAMQNRTRGRTRSELAAIGHEFGRRTSGKTVVHRRVINQPSDGDVEISTTRQPVRQYPRRRVTVYRGESRRPSYNHPSSRVVEQNQRRRIVQKRLRTSSEATIARSDESVTDDVRNITEEHISRDRVENAGRRTRVVLKKVKQRAEEGERSAIPAEETLVLGESSNLPNNEAFQSHREDKKLGRRRKVVVKRIKPQAEEKARTNNTDSSDRHPPGESQSDLTETDKLKKRTRVVLKRLKPITEDRNSTIRGASIDSDSGNENLTQTLPSNLRAGNGLPNEGNARRRTRVVLKSIKPISQERKATKEVSTKLGATNKNLFNERTSRRMRVVLKSVRPKLEREGAAIEEQEEASDDPDSTGDDLQGNYSNNLYVSDDPPDEKKSTRSKPEEEEEEEATTRSEQLAEPRGTETTSVRVEEDTDQPSHEVNTWKIDVSEPIGRVPTIRRPHRQRTPTTTHSTTQVPLTNSLPNVASTVQRRSRPFTEATLSSRIDLVDPYEVTESPYVRSTEVDQRAELSDQSIRAQEFAVTLADPPSSSSSGTGRTPLRDAARRKISTTISPRTEPTLTSRTISRYDDISNNGVSRSRQGSRTKDRPTVNATTRPRRPPIVDYDYYEDEVPIIAGKSSLLNSKLFLTSKGTIRCLDQGNFPHPYSCRKFITCARMVNGQVIGTEYTCPAKLSFDPIGGICNWSAGLGCKD